MAADARQRRRSSDRTGLRRRPDGRVQCHRHGKAWYATEAEATRVMLEVTHQGDHDPGLTVYPCEASNGWHIGHEGGWRSLGRLMQEAR